MADKFNIPDSFNPAKKVVTTPRTSVTIGLSQAASRAKISVIKSNIPAELLPDESVKSAILGTPVYDQLVIKKAIDTVVNSDQTSTDYVKFDAVIIVINQNRNIVTTPIQGRNGTVKEYISDGDYDINVRGIIASPYPERSPREEIENISELFKLQNELVVVSEYLALFKVQYAVVQSYSFSQIEGSINQVMIDLRLLSDDPIELKLGIDPDA
jgi:DNA primase large subunit